MSAAEGVYAVMLYGDRVGTLLQRGDHTQFRFDQDYLDNPRRPVLGLRFEERLRAPYSAALRLPRWFSNLLPEGPLRRWIADYRSVSLDREMELLAQVGHDLPGAVQVLPTVGDRADWEWYHDEPTGPHSSIPSADSPWRFSLAGVALKFSMLAAGDRLAIPAAGDYGDWIVKFPDQRFADVPKNEYAMMSLAGTVGLDVPEVRLVHRDDLVDLPARIWPGAEQWAYAIQRFDRKLTDRRSFVHIEDLAQVRDVYPEQKYQGTFETVAALLYRGRDLEALREFARRLIFFVLVGNGDAHLKNWSLIYHDRRVPTLSPAYDIVSTAPYRALAGGSEDLGLKFRGSRRFDSVELSDFGRLESRLDRRFGPTGANLIDVVGEVVRRTAEEWPRHRDLLGGDSGLARSVDEWIEDRVRRLSAPVGR